MPVDQVARVRAELLEQLGAESPTYVLAQLERFHIAEHRRGSAVTYLVARDDPRGTALGMTPVYLAVPPWDPAIDPASILEPAPPVLDARLCVVGSAGAYTNYFDVSRAVGEADAERVATDLVERARNLARDAGTQYVLLPHLDARQARLVGGYHTAAVSTSEQRKAVLPVVWDSFDGYVASLPTKRRWQVRQERKALRDSRVVVREESLAEAAAELAPLLAQTQKRYGLVDHPAHMEFYLTMLALTFAERCLTLVARTHDRAVAFALLLRAGERWFTGAWGCDYGALDGAALYFNLVYYEPIRRAIAEGVTSIDFGVGSLEAKRLRGCRLEPLRTILLPSAAVAPRVAV